jgi:PhzF family phenazine biosynthesis protein
MSIPFYQVDAFSDKAFKGNPAAVCPLDEWLDDEVMQNIAMENNLAETAFFVCKEDKYEIRWFTPTCEVNLCGHATLASAYVLFNYLDYDKKEVLFDSKSGPLRVSLENDLITLDFPSEPATACDTPQEVIDAFGYEPVQVLQSFDYIVVFEDGFDLQTLNPNLDALRKLELRGVCVTTTHTDYDFVCRFFAPKYGIDEDSVTGSAYTQLTSYWSERLGSKVYKSKQLSSRGGEVTAALKGDRVLISGQAVCCIRGEIFI